jgi:NAD(P)-dependent dehydrogenase (short-subunit alcohol dehydrogenase family)
MELNFVGPVSLSLALGDHLLRNGKGAAIVNIASVNAFRGVHGMLQYNAAKAALVSATKTLAVAWATKGVRVNAVCPGSTSTPAWELSDWPVADQDFIGRQNPMRRWGKPAEIASVVAFLASKDASYVTGESFVVDGGLLAQLVTSSS